MHRTLEAALEREPRTTDGDELLARAIDAILGLARDQPVLMRTHMAGILQAEGFVRCPEQQRLAELLRDTVLRHGSPDVDTDYPLLRAADGRGLRGAASWGADAGCPRCGPSCSSGTALPGTLGSRRAMSRPAGHMRGSRIRPRRRRGPLSGPLSRSSPAGSGR